MFVFFSDADMGPLTLASTITPLSSPGLCSPSSGTQLDGLEHDNEMDTGKYLEFENNFTLNRGNMVCIHCALQLFVQ